MQVVVSRTDSPPLFLPWFLSTEANYLLLPQSTDLCYTGNIQEKMSSFGGDLMNKRIEDNFLQEK